ncbi:zinc-ribbon domain-containing protein [Thalassococcus lentus]|uniref:Zinc-ribbon domain-containing protein n=1 Tax=Thalassococcus lentus TaxID=1210524 RepID=A0ABT4XWY9_9RHOB|nr:zinc-ribbon domain-containing protein [Thalassococcus lentus]MDA7426484.1 zinc-ribbon domain-containing protein [Thalassococcus lentus]
MSKIRLICPNCAAQYEVPVDVIPQGGRDVQCSNCGHTWFQNHPDDDQDLAEELNQPIPDPAWQPDESEPDDWQEQQVQSPMPEAKDAVQNPTVAPRQPEEYEPEQPVAAQTPPPPPMPEQAGARQLDPEVAELLREEREHERRQRAAEASAFESQPDLGLSEPDEDEQARRAREARERMAIMRGEQSPDAGPAEAPIESGRDAALAAAAAAGSRRQLLPDVEEINQTLRTETQPRAVDQAERRELEDEPQPRSGFGRAFVLIVLLAAIAIAIYIFAPQIAEAVPALAPTLDAYVAQVDALRLWLDGQVAALMAMLDGMSSEAADAATEGDS